MYFTLAQQAAPVLLTLSVPTESSDAHSAFPVSSAIFGDIEPG